MTAGPIDPAPPVRIRISDTLVARVAAQCALRMPGVVALHADLGQALLGITGSVLGPDALRPPPPAGASADVGDGTVAVRLTVATRIGHNCRDLAQALQRDVAAEVAAYTGLRAVVTVTIAEVLLS
jgi:uncharacterized alkaline shock family protein YloU